MRKREAVNDEHREEKEKQRKGEREGGKEGKKSGDKCYGKKKESKGSWKYVVMVLQF